MGEWIDVVEARLLGQNWLSRGWSEKRVDPYLVWADVTQFVDVGGEPVKWISLSLELKSNKTVQRFVEALSIREDNTGDNQWIQIGELYKSNVPYAMERSRFCTALVTREFFARLVSEDDELSQWVERFEQALAIVTKSYLTERRPPANATRSHRGSKKACCVVGIIDDGISFLHERFRDKDGKTRIEFLWDQGYFSPNPSSTKYGEEFTNEDIDNYLDDLREGKYASEEAAYQDAGYDAVRRRLAHGTFVLNIAGGERPEDVTEITPSIIGVHLQSPSRTTRDRSAGWLTARVIDGMRYIIGRAEKVATNCPVVVNLSFGNIAGPHDGSSMMECALDEMINLRNEANAPLKAVFGAGNSNLTRCHALFRLKAGESRELAWRALPDDPTPNFLEVWMPKTDSKDVAPQIEIRVSPPDGGAFSEWMKTGQVKTWCVDDVPLCTIVYLRHVATGDRPMILVALAPSFSHDESRRTAPAGTWNVEVRNTADQGEIEINAWVQRDETPFNFPRHARQSRFEDRKYERFDIYGYLKDYDHGNRESYVRRYGTVNSIATGEHIEAIGGYRLSDGRVVRYSSSGPAVNDRGLKRFGHSPDALAIADDSVTCHGVLSVGSVSGSTIFMDGTSVAAPQITRAVAEAMIVENITGGPPNPRGTNGRPATTWIVAETQEKRLRNLTGGVKPRRGQVIAPPTGMEHSPIFRWQYGKPPVNRGGWGRIYLPAAPLPANAGGRQLPKYRE